jgi:uncharacterized hydrophobic protein (TIGR00341 family)
VKRITVFAKRQDSEKIADVVEELVHYREFVEDAVKFVIYVPDSMVDSIVDKLRNSVDLRFKESSIAVDSPDFVISSALKRADRKVKKDAKPPVEELISSANKYSVVEPMFILLTTIAGLIALTGLFLNNVAVIIGAMLLSPLLGPIYSFAINIAVGRVENAGKSVVMLFISLGAVMIISYFITMLLAHFMLLYLTPEIILRLDNNPIYLLMAFLLGFAAVLALSRGISESIAGIAIAAALLPPATVVGIAAFMAPEQAIKPLLLTINNVVGLMAGTLFALPVLRIGPRYYYEKSKARRFLIRLAVVFSMLIAILAVLSTL